MLYIVFDDDETWSSAAYVVPEEVLTDEQKERISESDSKVFRDATIPGISVHQLVYALKKAGLWDNLWNKMLKEHEARNEL